MSDLAYLVYLPVGLSLVLAVLRRHSERYWWLALVVVTVAQVTAMIWLGSLDSELVGPLVLFSVPTLLMFWGLRANLFERHVYLVPLLGPVIYWAGVCLAMSFLVTLGIMGP